MIQNIKRAQLNLNKCHSPIGVWSEGYRHEIRLTAELMLLSARVGRALLMFRQNVIKSDFNVGSDSNGYVSNEFSNFDDAKVTNRMPLVENYIVDKCTIAMEIGKLQPTFRTDIANK